MKLLDLFSGIGGFSLAAHRMGWETAAFVEWDNELHRMNGPERRRVTQVYPFCGYEHDGKKMRLIQEPHIDPMTRSQIQRWLTDAGFEIPPKSSCVFCPYMSNISWREMKKNEYQT